MDVHAVYSAVQARRWDGDSPWGSRREYPLGGGLSPWL